MYLAGNLKSRLALDETLCTHYACMYGCVCVCCPTPPHLPCSLFPFDCPLCTLYLFRSFCAASSSFPATARGQQLPRVNPVHPQPRTIPPHPPQAVPYCLRYTSLPLFPYSLHTPLSGTVCHLPCTEKKKTFCFLCGTCVRQLH